MTLKKIILRIQKDMEKVDKIPTYELLKEVSLLDQEINLKILKYNLLVEELLKRYPDLSKDIKKK